MYNCVLWAGSHLPLPASDGYKLVSHNSWRPLFASKEEIPLFWWFLLDRFNCFWLKSGAPIFVVDRVSALARAEERYDKVEAALAPAQCLLWREFLDSLKSCTEDIFNIQIEGLWEHRLSANTEHFDAYLNKCFLPLEGTAYGSRQQQERKKEFISECIAQVGVQKQGLYGERPLFAPCE